MKRQSSNGSKTDKNGKAKISDLSVGKYKLVEKESYQVTNN